MMSNETSEAPVTLNFAQLGLDADLLSGVNAAGYVTPSPIQALAIPEILAGKDVIAKAQTGTGKTAAFGLGVMNRIKSPNRVEVLVLTPTRELALQVSDELYKLGQHKKIRTLAVCGGTSYDRQIELVNRGVNVVVATPGRLLDHLSSGRFKNFAPSMVVLDEADIMLNMGFLEDIEAIFDHLPEERQTLMFSATMPKEIRKLANDILIDPVTIEAPKPQETPIAIAQFFCVMEDHEREDAVTRLIEWDRPEKTIIFCRTKRETDELHMTLVKKGFNARAIHGDLEQKHRQAVIKSFRSGDSSILVATDVAARGLDISDVTHVINYHVPSDPEDYIHRIGRTGRAGKSGYAITLLNPRELGKFRRIEEMSKSTVTWRKIPSLTEMRSQNSHAIHEHLLNEPIHPSAKEFALLMNELGESNEDLLVKLMSYYLHSTQRQRKDEPETIGWATFKPFSQSRPRSGGGFGGNRRFGGGGYGGGGKRPFKGQGGRSSGGFKRRS